ncbi:MAG TPA: class I SAM-dependent methyltransferase [Thermoanaerobaculia bacterium]|jgi:SAM-dependent methyltransferase
MSAIRASLASLARRWSALRAARAEAAAARDFWDAGAPGEPEDRYWGAQPLVRRAINRRVTGDPNRWPMEWFAEKYVPAPLSLGLSVGCGTGLLERDVFVKGICERLEGVDFSPESIAEARRGAEEAGLARRLEYRVEDINAIRLPREHYDIVFFHGSLHHIRNVEHVLAEVRVALKPGGLLYLDEYMGPSRSEWTDAQWSFARSAFDALAAELKNRSALAIPLPMDDPSESVRSSAILPGTKRLFQVLEDRPYGGNVLWFVFPCLDMARLREDGTEALSRLIALEDHLLEKGWVESYFRVIVARKT